MINYSIFHDHPPEASISMEAEIAEVEILLAPTTSNVTCGDMCVRALGPQPTCNGHCRMHIALPTHHSSLRTVCNTHCQTMCS